QPDRAGTPYATQGVLRDVDVAVRCRRNDCDPPCVRRQAQDYRRRPSPDRAEGQAGPAAVLRKDIDPQLTSCQLIPGRTFDDVPRRMANDLGLVGQCISPVRWLRWGATSRGG